MLRTRYLLAAAVVAASLTAAAGCRVERREVRERPVEREVIREVEVREQPRERIEIEVRD